MDYEEFPFIAIYPEIGGGALDSFFTISVGEQAILSQVAIMDDLDHEFA